jgi:hypothetical protein
MTKLVLKLAVIFGGQGVLACQFYQSRVVELRPGFPPSWTDSDFIWFGLPFVIGFVLAALVLFSSFSQLPASKRIAATLGLSAAGAVVASFVGTVIAFNLYGT